ncbi:MAG: hypothetical protein OXB93_02135 [Cytophagales bacterium]|nr:hypothetical protein [Cytophagales bacterium]
MKNKQLNDPASASKEFWVRIHNTLDRFQLDDNMKAFHEQVKIEIARSKNGGGKPKDYTISAKEFLYGELNYDFNFPCGCHHGQCCEECTLDCECESREGGKCVHCRDMIYAKKVYHKALLKINWKVGKKTFAEELDLWEKALARAKVKIKEWRDIISDEYNQIEDGEYDTDKCDLWKVCLEMRECYKYFEKLDEEITYSYYSLLEKQRNLATAIRRSIASWSVVILRGEYGMTDSEDLFSVLENMDTAHQHIGHE